MASLKYLEGPNIMTFVLGSDYTAGDGHMSLAAGQGAYLPATGDFWIHPKSDSPGNMHVHKVTARTDDELTTVPVTAYGDDSNLSSGTELVWSLTKEALDQLRADLIQTGTAVSKVSEKAGNLRLSSDAPYLYRDTGSTFAKWGPIFPLVEPVFANFTTEVKPGNATMAQSNNGGILASLTTDASIIVELQAVPVSAPWRLEIACLASMSNLNYDRWGIVGQQSSDGKLFFWVFENSTTANRLIAHLRTSTGGYTSEYYAVNQNIVGGLFGFIFLGYQDDGTNRICEISNDGIVWKNMFQHGRTTGLTIDRIGIIAAGNTTKTGNFRFIHYKLGTI